MPICLVLHEFGRAGPAAEQALFGAVFEVASSHWRVTPSATLVGTDVSPAYLRDHLLRGRLEVGLADHAAALGDDPAPRLARGDHQDLQPFPGLAPRQGRHLARFRAS